MKYLLLAFVVVITADTLEAQAQFETGTFSASGSVGFRSQSDETPWSETSHTSFSMRPAVSVFAWTAFEIQVGPSFEHVSYRHTLKGSLIDPSTRSTFLGMRLGIRYYLTSVDLAPFIGLHSQYSWLKISNAQPDQRFSTPTREFGGEIGMEIFITPHVALEPAVLISETDHEEWTTMMISAGFGFKYFIF